MYNFYHLCVSKVRPGSLCKSYSLWHDRPRLAAFNDGDFALTKGFLVQGSTCNSRVTRHRPMVLSKRVGPFNTV